MDGNRTRIFHGTLIHSLSQTNIEILRNTLIVIDHTGTVTETISNIPSDQVQQYVLDHDLQGDHRKPAPSITYLSRNQFLIPGFIDTHNHAPQYSQRGLGRGMQILDWLNNLTFRNEAKFSDSSHARKIYPKLVKAMLRQGVTTVSYYGSIHLEATKILADVCLEQGQRALIGKTNMDAPGQSPDWYREKDAASSIADTIALIKYVHIIDPDSTLIRPVITPRFAISCTPTLLEALGTLAKPDHPDNPYSEPLPIQTHFNEAASEVSYTLSLFKSYDHTFKDEVDLYNHFNLLTPHSILAHCTTAMTPSMITALKTQQCGIAHCPIANVTVGGGFMVAPIRKFLQSGIEKIGLGTDVGGGWSCSVLDVMKWAWVSSNCRAMMGASKEEGRWARPEEEEEEQVTIITKSDPLTISECFYMATLGGAKVLSLDSKVGNFVAGKEFDALVIDMSRGETGDDDEEDADEDIMTVFEKFLVRGDDRDVKEVYVRGRKVKG